MGCSGNLIRFFLGHIGNLVRILEIICQIITIYLMEFLGLFVNYLQVI